MEVVIDVGLVWALVPRLFMGLTGAVNTTDLLLTSIFFFFGMGLPSV